MGGARPGFLAGIATVQETLAMPRFGIPNRNANERIREIAQINWRRGLFRVWLLLSAAWIMGWTVYLILNGIKDGVQRSGDLLAIPVLLIGPPIALLLFGIVAGWALRGFVPD
jgi:hypothetical protein